ncbi:hypothetical protein B0H11DRAFT_2192978 [Mycena galericulata]|nr:hypothetical protein B0H11DRAFT_2192978 [Mycena galericulata]
MAESVPVVQILDKSHFTKQHLVSLPDAYPLPPLVPDSIRILGWWDVWAPPSLGLPAPYDDGAKFGCAHLCVGVRRGGREHASRRASRQLYGYVPIGTLPEDLHIAPTEVAGHWVETNRAWDALMRVLFETSYVTNRYAFAWAGGDASVVDALLLFAPSGKTALALAHQLRHARPPAAAPQRVIGVGSASSRAFTRGTRLFDDVLLYDDCAARDLAQRLGLADSDTNTKIVLVEFGARGEAALAWFRALQALSPTPTQTRAVIVGSDPAAPGRSTLASLTADPTRGVVQMRCARAPCTPTARRGTFRGWKRAAWAAFKDTEGGAVKGVGVKWGEGMEAVREGWEGLAGGVTCIRTIGARTSVTLVGHPNSIRGRVLNIVAGAFSSLPYSTYYVRSFCLLSLTDPTV